MKLVQVVFHESVAERWEFFNCEFLYQNLVQLIQAVTFSSPNVGGHGSNL